MMQRIPLQRAKKCQRNLLPKLAYKSSSNVFTSAKHEQWVFNVFCGIKRALGQTTGSGNEKRRTLRKFFHSLITMPYHSARSIRFGSRGAIVF